MVQVSLTPVLVCALVPFSAALQKAPDFLIGSDAAGLEGCLGLAGLEACVGFVVLAGVAFFGACLKESAVLPGAALPLGISSI